METLPTELLAHIFDYVGGAAPRAVCEHWRRVFDAHVPVTLHARTETPLRKTRGFPTCATRQGGTFDGAPLRMRVRGVDTRVANGHVSDSTQLSAVLLKTPLLRTLILTGMFISDDCWVALGAGLAHLPRLQTLDIDRISIGPGGTIALLAGLVHTPRLEVLSMQNLFPEGVPDAVAAALAAALRHVPRLTSLDLSLQAVSCGAMRTLGDAFVHTPLLTRLAMPTLEYRRQDGAGVAALCAAVTNTPLLEDLWTEFEFFCPGRDAALRTMLTGLARLTRLRILISTRRRRHVDVLVGTLARCTKLREVNVWKLGRRDTYFTAAMGAACAPRTVRVAPGTVECTVRIGS